MKRSILCLAALLLAACGASGALYLPDQQPPRSNNPLKKEQRKTDAQPAPAEAPPAATPPQGEPATQP